jgi:hypothetical protein
MTAEQFVDAVWQLTGAAPTKADAQVVRAKLNANGDSAAARPLTAKWIWSSSEADKAPAGQAITFRRQFKLASAPLKAVAVITCDNEYKLFVNGREAEADADWQTGEVVALEPYLKAGDNEILIVGKNGGQQPNAAGLIFEASLKLADGTEQTIATGSDWQWTTAQPDAKGKFAKPPMDWQTAAELKPASFWTDRVGDALAAMLHQAGRGPIRPVRAALVKSDALMRALGRPNRDQIVTMRPSELTTLEAIDLANGETLAAAVEKGAKKLVDSSASSTAELVRRVYLAGLSRPPSEEEAAAAVQMLGTEPTAESIEDLLWAILMLPEFQLVR